MKALICGSMAYDHIMVFEDKFKNHILPDKVHILNVSFLVPQMRREFGGCAGNIGYNLKLLGDEPLMMATVGDDFAPYRDWLKWNEMDCRYIRQVANTFTGQAFITTDLDDNQITAFHPGAMNHAHENHVESHSDIRIGIISPDGREGMVQHAREFKEAGIPFIFDPGQGMPMFDGNDLLNFMQQATWATLNDYEAQLLQDRTGKTLEELVNLVEAIVVTKGGLGSEIYTKARRYEIPAVKPMQISDPTGCGDAYRAGLLYGLMRDLDWQITGQIATLMGTYKIEQAGTQNHHFDMEEFMRRYESSFKANFPEAVLS